jgi:hypothetical protein
LVTPRCSPICRRESAPGSSNNAKHESVLTDPPGRGRSIRSSRRGAQSRALELEISPKPVSTRPRGETGELDASRSISLTCRPASPRLTLDHDWRNHFRSLPGGRIEVTTQAWQRSPGSRSIKSPSPTGA